MKNKELQKQVEDMIVVLNDLIDQVTACETANDTLVVELSNLKTRNLLISQERDQLKEDLQDLKYEEELRGKEKDVAQIELDLKEELPVNLNELYVKFEKVTRKILENVRVKYGKNVITIKDPEYRRILLQDETVNINSTLKILSERKVNGHPAVTLTYDTKQDKKIRLLNFKFNY